MKNILELLHEIAESAIANGGMDVEMDFESGSFYINGIEVNRDTQKEIMDNYADLKIDTPFGVGVGVDMSKFLKVPTENTFPKIFPDSSTGDKVIDFPSSTFHDQGSLNDFFKKKDTELKEKEIKKLREELEALRKENERLKRDTPEFPDDFDEVDGGDNPDNWLSDEDIQEMVDEVAYLEVPLYSFASEMVGDTVVIKIHDDEGEHLIVAQDYYITKLK